METTDLSEAGVWERLLTCLPKGYVEGAKTLGALVRPRKVRSADDLLRLAMAYSTCDLPLRATAGWAALEGIADMTSQAVLKRLSHAAPWLGWMVGRLLEENVDLGRATSRPVRVLDATVVSEPGAVGTSWRIHVGLDLAKQTIGSVEITGPSGGERFGRHAIRPGEILLADAGYSHRAGVSYVLHAGGHVVVRANWQSFPLEDAEGATIDPLQWAETLAVGGIGDRDAWFRSGSHRHQVRLVAVRLSAEPDPKKVVQIRKRARKKNKTPDPRALLASCFVLVLTDLPREELPGDQVLELYRLRWRVETAFKRYKSVLHLDGLRAHRPDLVATYLCTKLLTAILLERLELPAPPEPEDSASSAEAPGSSPPSADPRTPPIASCHRA